MKWLALSVLLLAVVGSQEGDAFSLSDVMNAAKGMKEKIMDEVKKHMAVTPAVKKLVDDLPDTIAKHLKDSLPKDSKYKIEDVEALKKAIKTMMHMSVKKSLAAGAHVDEMAKTLVTKVKDYTKAVNPAAAAKIKVDNMTKHVAAFLHKKHDEHRHHLSEMLSKHGIKLPDSKLSYILHRTLWAMVHKKDAHAEMMKALEKASEKAISDKVKKALKSDLKAAQLKMMEKGKKEYQDLMKKLNVSLPTEKLLCALNKSLHYKLPDMMAHPDTIENALDEHSNKVLDWMHKAVGNINSELLHELMEKLRVSADRSMEQKIKEMSEYFKKKGMKVSRMHILVLIQGHSKPPKEEEPKDDDDADDKKDAHKTRGKKWLWAYIFGPIGGVILITLIAVGVAAYCRNKRRRSSREPDALPSKRTNPYGNLDEDANCSNA